MAKLSNSIKDCKIFAISRLSFVENVANGLLPMKKINDLLSPQQMDKSTSDGNFGRLEKSPNVVKS